MVSSSSTVCRELANYTFSFTPSDPILKGGSIRIVLTYFDMSLGQIYGNSPLDTLNKQSLQIVSGIDPNATIDTTKPSIIISNIFPNGNSDTTTNIQFVINGILNPPSTELYVFNINF